MRAKDIKAGKTYEGKGGALRRVIRIDKSGPHGPTVWYRTGTREVNYGCLPETFARWAVSEAPAAPDGGRGR